MHHWKHAFGKSDFVQRHSDLSILRGEPSGREILVKKIRCQVAADYTRRYLGRSQASREYHASRLLHSIGVRCPEPLAYGINLLPFGPYESLFFCEYLSRYVNATTFLEQNADATMRRDLIEAAARDLARIHARGYFHKDSHFGNILCDPSNPGVIAWIDNDLKKAGTIGPEDEGLAFERFGKAIRRKIVNADEWELFRKKYVLELRSFPDDKRGER
ncbi:MAG TPA: lipopolysaccharide kinase InaA family protein [Deltaproteobacteria bacterium]|nr:lipopolysaccharide kinase InaA family protein [Deltaproteobacteria bacterium]